MHIDDLADRVSFLSAELLNVLAHMADGLSNGQIASRVGYNNAHVVGTYVYMINKALGLTNIHSSLEKKTSRNRGIQKISCGLSEHPDLRRPGGRHKIERDRDQQGVRGPNQITGRERLRNSVCRTHPPRWAYSPEKMTPSVRTRKSRCFKAHPFVANWLLT
jgi:hypothetical protein